MSKLARNLLLVGSMIVSGATNAAIIDDMSPLVGIDYQHAWMEDKETDAFNRRSFPNSYPGGSLYVGARFCENFGVELGYDWSARVKRNETFTIEDGRTINSDVRIRRAGGHLDLSGYVPVADCLELVGVIGVGYVHPKIEHTLSDTVVSVNSAVSGKGAAVARIRAGFNYMITECVGLRGLVGWESTRSLRARGTFPDGSSLSFKPFKDTVTASAGLFFKW